MFALKKAQTMAFLVAAIASVQSLMAHPGHAESAGPNEDLNPFHFFTHPDHALWTWSVLLAGALITGIVLRRRAGRVRR